MCGIFGGIGNPNPYILRALAMANRDRGKESLGFFNSQGKLIKRAGDPLDVLAEPDIGRFIHDPKSWFMCGHTRYATRGKVVKRNAHPFRRGRIVGVHNGVVHAPKKYKVDSEYLIDRLNSCASYQEALESVSGYWALAWFNGADLYLSCHDNRVAIARTADAIYFSSDWAHLEACGLVAIDSLADGETIRFDLKLADKLAWEECERVNVHATRVAKDWRTTGKRKPGQLDKEHAEPEVVYMDKDGACYDLDDWQYLESLADELGYQSADAAMSFWGCVGIREAIDALEYESEQKRPIDRELWAL